MAKRSKRYNQVNQESQDQQATDQTQEDQGRVEEEQAKVDTAQEQAKQDAEQNEVAQNAPGYPPQDKNVAEDASRPRVDNLYNCPDCKGTGLVDVNNPATQVCSRCNGTGRV